MAYPVSSDVLGSFFEEARGNLVPMRRCLEALEAAPQDREPLVEFHRLAHNVRGASHVISLPGIGQIAQGMEDLLDQIATGDIPLDADILGLLRQGLDRISEALAEAAQPPPPPPAAATGGEDLGHDILDGFLQEADEHLHAIAPWLAELAHAAARQPLLQEIRRSVHTIKGAAAMVGLRAISQLAHRMEDLLDQLYDGAVAFTPACAQLLDSTCDLLNELVEARGRTSGFEDRIAAAYESYSSLLATPAPQELAPETAEPEPSTADAAPPDAPAESSRLLRVPAERLDELMRLVGELFVQHSIFEQKLEDSLRELDELRLSQQRLKRLSAQMEAGEALWLPGAGSAGAEGSDRPEFDALELDRYTQLHLMSRDLTETSSDLSTAGNQLGQLLSGFRACITQQGRLSGEMQDKLMAIRQVPLATLASRLQRAVRVTATRCGKQAGLALEGAATELDKKVLDELAGPLQHLLRNAVDHGIETPEERAAAGKPERSIIRLRAAHEGTDVVIRLSDDGRGLDEEKLRREALARGYGSEQGELTAAQLHSLVFEPGFSTAPVISEISGRGVGLDVVKASVEALKGSLLMDSQPGRGVTFTLRIPVTLAIAKVLLVESRQQTVALPLASVSQAARVDPEQFEHDGETLRVSLGARALPGVDLAQALGLLNHYEPRVTRSPVVVLRVGEQEFAVAVDRIHGAREVAVKPLAGILGRLAGVAGATILGDGSVILILNPAALVPGVQTARAPERPVRTPAAPARKPLDILIVDDSLSVRRVVANLIRSTGWNPVLAKDGVEALEILEATALRPDAILLDVEMPRMDGFALTERLRAHPDYRHTPILMLTSRAGDKHRNKAFQLGVTDYLVKPYQDEVLISAIRKTLPASSSV